MATLLERAKSDLGVPDRARDASPLRTREWTSTRQQHQLLGIPFRDFDNFHLEVHNQRFHNGISVFLFAAHVVKMLSG
jgi:hypothetical protein